MTRILTQAWREIRRSWTVYRNVDMFNLFPAHRHRTVARLDRDALDSDWQAIGHDLRYAMAKADREIRSQDEP